MFTAHDLSTAQSRVLDYIIRFVERTDRFPTAREVARGLEFSSLNAVYDHFKVLARKGYIEKTRPGGWRGWRLTKKASVQPRGLPLFESISAGPHAYIEDIEPEWMESITDLLPHIVAGDYLLRIEGDSMIEAGLHSGMLAHMRTNIEAQPKDVCAFWVNGLGGTLKYFYPEPDCVRLVPANPDYEEQHVEHEDVHIQGILMSAVSVVEFTRAKAA